MQLVIRRYRPSDQDQVFALSKLCIEEHIRPCFYSAMTSPLYLAITLALCVAGYQLYSVLGAVVLPGVWMSLVNYCCHELFASYVRVRTDLQDIPGNYLSRPDDCYWVAATEVDGRTTVMGMVGVVCRQSGTERHGELFRMMVSPSCRRVGLGTRLAQTVIDFCKERGFSKVVLRTTTAHTAGGALYKKLGFIHVLSHMRTPSPVWVVKLAKVTVLVIEKVLK